MQQSEKSKPIMISTHTSLAGRDLVLIGVVMLAFLLTRPSRDVTLPEKGRKLIPINFYSHVPRGT